MTNRIHVQSIVLKADSIVRHDPCAYKDDRSESCNFYHHAEKRGKVCIAILLNDPHVANDSERVLEPSKSFILQSSSLLVLDTHYLFLLPEYISTKQFQLGITL
jgi:hypothetical protein